MSEPLLQRLKDAVNAWHETAVEYSRFGAHDTEPRNIFAREVELFAAEVKEDPDADVPVLDGDEWDLFTHSMDCEEAVGPLNEKLAAVCEIVREAKGELELTGSYLCYNY